MTPSNNVLATSSFPAGLGVFSVQIFAEQGSTKVRNPVEIDVPGSHHAASVCGDGIVEAFEQCDSRGPLPALDRAGYYFMGTEDVEIGDEASWFAPATLGETPTPAGCVDLQTSLFDIVTT